MKYYHIILAQQIVKKFSKYFPDVEHIGIFYVGENQNHWFDVKLKPNSKIRLITPSEFRVSFELFCYETELSPEEIEKVECDISYEVDLLQPYHHHISIISNKTGNIQSTIDARKGFDFCKMIFVKFQACMVGDIPPTMGEEEYSGKDPISGMRKVSLEEYLSWLSTKYLQRLRQAITMYENIDKNYLVPETFFEAKDFPYE